MESRWTMAAPEISWLSPMMIDVHRAALSGYIVDESPAATSLTLSGAMSGAVPVDSSGYFWFEGDVSSLGEVTASVTDAEGLSATRSATFTNSAPTVDYLYAMTTGNGKEVSIVGHVSDDFAAGSVVRLGGEVSATLVVDSSGYFWTTLTAEGLGTITADATDYWGAQSSTQSTQLYAEAPQISWVCVYESGRGRVLSVYAAAGNLYGSSASATISGIISTTITPDSSGSISTTQTAAVQGTVQIQLTNIWGLTATTSVDFQTYRPQVSSFYAFRMGTSMWMLGGSVYDEFAAGLTVRLSSEHVSTTAEVKNDGTFMAFVQGCSGDTISASVTDWWGVQSVTAVCYAMG